MYFPDAYRVRWTIRRVRQDVLTHELIGDGDGLNIRVQFTPEGVPWPIRMIGPNATAADQTWRAWIYFAAGATAMGCGLPPTRPHSAQDREDFLVILLGRISRPDAGLDRSGAFQDRPDLFRSMP